MSDAPDKTLAERVEALRALVADMTAAPWGLRRFSCIEGGPTYQATRGLVTSQIAMTTVPQRLEHERDPAIEQRCNAAGIVALRNEAPAIIDALSAEVERLSKELIGLHEAHCDACGEIDRLKSEGCDCQAEQDERVRLQARINELEREASDRAPAMPRAEVERLRACEKDAEKYRALSTPEIADFLASVEREALHQRDRWGVEHDAGKADSDWYWLIGFLAGKALHKPEKVLHHIITTAAACLNWHAHKIGVHTAMRPGISGEAAVIAPKPNGPEAAIAREAKP